MMQRQHGSTLSEYGFVLALVGVAAIGALVLLGGSLRQALGSMNDGFNRMAAAQPAVQAGPGESQGGRNTGIGGVIPPPNAGQIQICADGWCVNVPDTENAQIAQTAGGMGGELTGEMANVLLQIAEQLKQDPNADPALINLITTMANEGHGLAASEKSYAEHVSANALQSGTWHASADNKAKEKIRGQAIAIDNGRWAFGSAFTRVKDYFKKHPESLPPEMQSVVLFEGNEIQKIAQAYPVHYQISLEDAESWRVGDPDLTHQKSDTVCANGGDVKRCVHRLP